MMIRRLLAVVLAMMVMGTVATAENRDGVAVIIGNKTYRKGVPAVDFAHNDAEAIRRWVVEGLGFREGNIFDLRDAGKAQLEAVFGDRDDPQGKLSDYVRPKESDVVVYYSGHGIPGPKDGRGYLLPSDADPDKIELNGYPLDVLMANLGKLPAKSVTVLLDACFSGLSPSGSLVSHASSFGIRPAQSKVPAGMTVLTAASGQEIAWWDLEAGHGLFTAHLLQAFSGEADKPGYGDGDGKVTLGEVKAYLADEITHQARRRFGRPQTVDITGDPKRVLATWTPGQAPLYFPPGTVFRDCSGTWCPEMVVVPAGSFTMGSPPTEPGRYDNDGPQHPVNFAKAFAVGKVEVTFAEWDACVNDGDCMAAKDEGWGRERQPVINVSWEDAQAYVAWLKRKTGQPYRLLSEAEWEYVARAKTIAPYWWGATASHGYANYGKDKCCGGLAVGKDQWETTAPVGRFPANGFGLHDLHGNVWEWVEDCWHATYAGAPDNGSAWTTEECKYRVVRGGSWYFNPRNLRSALRVNLIPGLSNNDIGFRVARTF